MDDRSTDANTDAAQQAAGLRELASVLVRDAGEADDLAQDAWLVLARRADVPTAERQRFGFGVLRNLARSRSRRERRRLRVEQSGSRAEAEPSAREELERDEVASSLRRHVLALPEPYRSVVESRYLEELSVEEVARRLGRPAATVRSQTARGLALLREKLDREHAGGRAAWAVSLASYGATRDQPEVAWTRRLLAGTAVICACFVTYWIAARIGLGEPSAPPAVEREIASARADGPAMREPSAGRRPVEAIDGRDASVANSTGMFGSAETPGSSRVAVVTVDARGEVVADADVYVVRRGEARHVATTDAAGCASFAFADEDLSADLRGPAPSQLALLAEDGASATSLLVVVDRWRAIADPVRIPLDRGGVIVRGRVFDAAGAPLAGAVVEYAEIVTRRVEVEPGVVRYDANVRQTTDEQGRFRMRASPGRLWLRASAPGRPMTTFAEEIGSSGEHECALHFPSGMEIHGRVTLASGSPASGARVFVDAGHEGRTHEVAADVDGRYVLLDVAEGRRLVWALHGSESTSQEFDARTGESSTWDARLARRPVLRLRVVDEFGAPRAGYGVCVRRAGAVSGWQRGVMTDGAGRVSVIDAPDGALDVYVAPLQRYVPYPVLERTLQRIEEQEVLLTLSSADAGAGSLRGTIVDAAGRTLDMRAGVVARMSGRTFVTDVPVDASSGSFRVVDLPRGEYAIAIALRSPHDSLEGLLEIGTHAIRAGQDQDLGVRVVPPGGFLAVRCAIDGSSAAFELDACRSDSTLVSIRTGARSLGEPIALLPGEYEVRLRDPWRVLGRGRARVEAGRTSALVVVPEPAEAR